MTFTLESAAEGVDLVVTGDWSSTAEDALVSGQADGLVLNYARGFREKSLEFIKGLPIRRLRLLARTATDLTPIYELADQLEQLDVQSDLRATIELDRLPLLRSLSADWRQVQGSIRFVPGLKHLFLLGYLEQDLAVLSSLTALESLVMKDYPLARSLDGIEDLPWLSKLGVHLGRDLEDITASRRIRRPKLEVLQLPSCRKVTEIETISSLPSLQFFELSEGAEIPTVSPLANLDHLERLYLHGSTKIADGDLGPIAQLPRLRDFRAQNRRGYSPSVKAIQGAIASRG
jgi:internalin A